MGEIDCSDLKNKTRAFYVLETGLSPSQRRGAPFRA